MWHSTSASALKFICFVALIKRVITVHVDPKILDACPGYDATNVLTRPDGLTAELVLGGKPCNLFGDDIKQLKLNVVYETSTRIHVKITDPFSTRYEVPESVLPLPKQPTFASVLNPTIAFNFTTSPFAFSIYRTSTKEILFSTISHPIIVESQYIRVKTQIPADANIYGLGEHSHTFRLPIDNTTLTLWSRDSFGIPTGTNLYGSHPIYFEHRTTGTHGVFFRNSNGMDIKVTKNGAGAAGSSLEYNVIGGVVDMYFLAGSETDPTEVAKQYANVVGTPADVPYWSFGLHQCRFGYKNFVDVANVITNYSVSKIPLETMWVDIDYMDRRRIFTVDPDYFPMNRMREIVSYLHARGQKFVLMTDPAVAFTPRGEYGPYDRGRVLDVFLKSDNGSESLGVVWPGVVVYPDWFHLNTQKYWAEEFKLFYNPTTGLDIDGVWIDMNEPANFCSLPCDDPVEQAIKMHNPPAHDTLPPDHNAHVFTNWGVLPAKMEALAANNESLCAVVDPDWLHPQSYWSEGSRSVNHPATDLGWFDMNGPSNFCPIEKHNASALDTVPSHPSIFFSLSAKGDLLAPPYAINNAFGPLSSRTVFTNIIHANGMVEYDTHNLYGTMMSMVTRKAMLARRPGKRTLVITRSTFAGAGAYTQKWLGDNLSTWKHYRDSIAHMLGFASIYQVPMVGSDVCGFAKDTTETLCARWAMLGAFYPFMRNHNNNASISQEFYIWPTVTQAARNALDMRYRLLDYIYTAFHQANVDGSPILHPMFFKYPKDPNTFAIEYQFFYGDSILISPVTEENATSVSIYLPKDTFYDFNTLSRIQGNGSVVTLNNIDFTQIPVHIKSGVVLPLRANSAMTTTELRKVDFELVVAPNDAGDASGQLYFDDSESLDVPRSSSTLVKFLFKDQRLVVTGQFGYPIGVNVSRVRILGESGSPKQAYVDGKPVESEFNQTTRVLDVRVGRPFARGFEVHYH